MDTLAQWHHETLGKRAVEALEKNQFTAAYFPEREAAVRHIMGLVPAGASVGIGGSKTEKDLALGRLLEESGHTVYDHNRGGQSAEERNAIRYKQMTADVFLCSSNAITLTGELVNRDGFGNRVAAMIFGPKRVIIVAGANKIVRDVDEADKRIKMTAAPMNCKRLGMPNPCVQHGECVDCRNETRSCRVTTVISRRPCITDIHVVIIGEELGF